MNESREAIDRFISTFRTMPLLERISFAGVPLDGVIARADALVEGELHDFVVGPDVRVTPALACEGQIGCPGPGYELAAELVVINARVTSLHSSEGTRDVGTVRVRLLVGSAMAGDRAGSEAFVARLRESIPAGIKFAAFVTDREGVLGHGGSALITSDGIVHSIELADHVAGIGMGEVSTVDELHARITQVAGPR